MHLRLIHAAIEQYERTLSGQPPATLSVLKEEATLGTKKVMFLPEQYLHCPGVDLEVGYFYLPIPSAASTEKRSDRLRACELNHDKIDQGRAILFDNGDVRSVPEAEFRRLLALPVNREFSEKFNKAEQAK